MLKTGKIYKATTGKTKATATIIRRQHVASRQFHASVRVGNKAYSINRLHQSEQRAYQAALQLIEAL